MIDGKLLLFQMLKTKAIHYLPDALSKDYTKAYAGGAVINLEATITGYIEKFLLT